MTGLPTNKFSDFNLISKVLEGTKTSIKLNHANTNLFICTSTGGRT